MIRPAIQLQTIENLPEPLPETIRHIDETPIEGVELWDPAIDSTSEVADALEATDLDVVGAHVRLDRLDDEYADVVERYEDLGCRRLVVPTFDENAFGSPEGIAAAADRLSIVAAKLADNGFACCYHNDIAEFVRVDGRTAYDAFVEATDDVAFELDTGLASYAGADPAAVLRRHGDRIPLVHLTDSVRGREATLQVELGAGEVAIDDCLDAAREADVEWAIYEHGMTDDTRGSLTHAATKLPRLVYGERTPSHSSRVSTD